MDRRVFLAGATAAAFAAGSQPLWAGAKRITRNRFSIITDECAKSVPDSIAFAKQYQLEWLELREVPGQKRHYAAMSEAELKEAHKQFADAGIRISFFNAGHMKGALPGITYSPRRNETAEAFARRTARDEKNFENRMADLEKNIRAAQLLGCDKVRVFAYLRAPEPEKAHQRVIDVLGEMSKVAEREKVKLLLENETSCNVASCAELAQYAKAIPSKAFGINWDPLNGHHLKEEVFPFGYGLLPKKKLWNVQIKGKSLLKEFPTDYLDWKQLFAALEKDGYLGQVGLETHIFGETQIARSHECIKEMIRLVEA